MIHIEEYVPLGAYTTLGVGGLARFFTTVRSRTQLREALHVATKQKIGVRILGGGSNTLVSDDGFDGLVIHMKISGITFRDEGIGAGVLVRAGAGVSWDSLVRYATGRGLWGVENLAGIPGTVGAAPVQNIGAYGAELSDTFVSADVVMAPEGTDTHVDFEHAQFGYRESIFKKDFSHIITNVTLRLLQKQTARKTHPDLEVARMRGVLLNTPSQIARALRDIRASKFSRGSDEGTAGSFFKNPIVSEKKYSALQKHFPKLPGFPIGGGVKIPLAWILDTVLHMRGFKVGSVYLNEHSPLVLMVHLPATAVEIETFAGIISERIKNTTGIIIEKEVCVLMSEDVRA